MTMFGSRFPRNTVDTSNGSHDSDVLFPQHDRPGATWSRRALALIGGSAVVIAAAVAGNHVAPKAATSADVHDRATNRAPTVGLTMTRADGSTYEFGGFDVSCSGQELTVQTPLTVNDGGILSVPLLVIRLELDRIVVGRPYELPTTATETEREAYNVFISDSGGSSEAANNEVSSS